MRQAKENIVKGWITTIIGTLTMILTLVLIWQKVIDFVWEGIGGLAIGSILLMAPRTIEKKVSEAIGAWGGRSNLSDSTPVPPTPPEPPDDEKVS